MQRRPPTKPAKYLKPGRKPYYAQYREDRLDEHGNVIGRRQRYVPLTDETGRRITAPRAADRACETLYESLMAAWSSRPRSPEALAAYKTRYLASHSRRQGTARSYETKLRSFIEFLESEHQVTRFAQLAREHIKSYLDHRQRDVKLVTVYGDLRTIRAFLNEAVRDGHLAANITKDIKLAPLRRGRASEGFFLPVEMDAIVDHCREREPDWLPIFAGFRYAPFRREELTYLEWSDLDFDRGLIRIADEKPAYAWRPKRTGRTMDLHPSLATILRSLPRTCPFVYQHPDRATFENAIQERHELGRKAWRKCKRLCDLLDLEHKDETGSWRRRFPNGAHLKAFRSGIACELQLRGAPLAYVQELLGHHDASITLEHYTHIVPELMGRLTKPFIGTLGASG